MYVKKSSFVVDVILCMAYSCKKVSNKYLTYILRSLDMFSAF